MDCADIKVEMSGGGLLDPLVIVEDGDETQGVASEGGPATEEDLVDREKAATGEEVAGQKEENERLESASDRQTGEEEWKTAVEDVNVDCSEAVKVEGSESCQQQVEGTESRKEDPNKVSGWFLFFVARKKKDSFVSLPPPTPNFK